MIRVLLVDDHMIVRQGLKQILADTDDIQVCGEAADGHAAMQMVRQGEFDLLIMDMSMPGRSGLELLKLIKAEKTKLPVLILSMHSEEQYAVRAYRAGASGYLTKDSASEQLVNAIRKVARGGVYISPSSAERLAQEFNTNQQDVLPHTLLSDREFQIFQFIAAGKSLTDIAAQLSLSVKTVSSHKTHILEKMHLGSTAELIRYAIEHELIEQN